MGLPSDVDLEPLSGRSILCRKTGVVPIECVVRGYLAGSGWKEYQQNGTVYGISLPTGLNECSQLDEPIFTPATKAQSGHDINISFDEMSETVGRDVSEQLREMSVDIYQRGAAYALERGIIIVDTKFEWGWTDDQLILIDEVLTPDSSRFWPADQYQAVRAQASFDKQFVRDWLETTSWDKNSQPPGLPESIVAQTREKYLDGFERLTRTDFPWK